MPTRPYRCLLPALLVALALNGVAAAAPYRLQVVTAPHPVLSSTEAVLFVTARDAQGHPAEGLKVAATFQPPSLPVPLQPVRINLQGEGDGRYAQVFDLPAPGTWRLHVTARGHAGSATATLRLAVGQGGPLANLGHSWPLLLLLLAAGYVLQRRQQASWGGRR